MFRKLETISWCCCSTGKVIKRKTLKGVICGQHKMFSLYEAFLDSMWGCGVDYKNSWRQEAPVLLFNCIQYNTVNNDLHSGCSQSSCKDTVCSFKKASLPPFETASPRPTWNMHQWIKVQSHQRTILPRIYNHTYIRAVSWKKRLLITSEAAVWRMSRCGFRDGRLSVSGRCYRDAPARMTTALPRVAFLGAVKNPRLCSAGSDVVTDGDMARTPPDTPMLWPNRRAGICELPAGSFFRRAQELPVADPSRPTCALFTTGADVDVWELLLISDDL